MCKTYVNIQTGEKLNLEKVFQLKDNAMLKARPELWCEWDFEKNSGINKDIWKMTKGINSYKVWWICPNCRSSYDMNINNRYHNNCCSYCAGKKVNHTNSLSSINPIIASQWHKTKNKKSPDEVTVSSNQKAWWLGDCGHEWESPISSRTKGIGCPYCAGQKLLVGFNDMWTTNPELARMLSDPSDGYKYMQYSHIKLQWKCPDCHLEIGDKDVRLVAVNGLACPECSDGMYYPEKVVYHTLNNLNIEFIWQKTFDWSGGKRFDFFTNDGNYCLIEVHGGQHSIDRGFERSGGKSIEEEQENDKYKYELAKKNGIHNYIVIDARYSDFEYIKKNILSSKLAELYDFTNTDWNYISLKSQSSLVFSVCELWNSGLTSPKNIAKVLKIDRNTVARYLKRGSDLGLCDYMPILGNQKSRKKVVQMSLDNVYINTFTSLTEACVSNNFSANNHSNISRCCSGIAKQAKGYKWMFLEDYENLLESQNKIS